MQKITPFLWLDNQAEEAAKFYTFLFESSKIGSVTRYGKEGYEIHRREAGSVMTFAPQHISVSINRPAEQVYAFASNSAHPPQWAAGLSGFIFEKVKRVGGENRSATVRCCNAKALHSGLFSW